MSPMESSVDELYTDVAVETAEKYEQKRNRKFLFIVRTFKLYFCWMYQLSAVVNIKSNFVVVSNTFRKPKKISRNIISKHMQKAMYSPMKVFLPKNPHPPVDSLMTSSPD